MLPSDTGDITFEEFNKIVHETAEWIANYRKSIESFSVVPAVKPGDIISQFPEAPPEQPSELTDILKEFDERIMKGILHWGHPSFLAYFGSTSTAPGIIGEMLSAALNVNAMTWKTSPSATELELLVLSWIRQMLKLPEEYFGVIYDTASVGVAHALACAREMKVPDAGKEGLSGVKLRIYTSDQTHNSIEKAAIILGIGEKNVVRIKSDSNFRMDVTKLREAIEKDIQKGYVPAAVVATAGTTSCTAVDPLNEIHKVCKEYNLWMHTDAAYGGSMALLPEGAEMLAGIEKSDSIIYNPHKWLFIQFDFSVMYIRNKTLLKNVFSLVAEYLQGDASASEINFMDYGIQLGRRFRALKAFFVIKAYGTEGIVSRIKENIRLAKMFESLVIKEKDFEISAPVNMAVVCFRYSNAGVEDETLNYLNKKIVEQINSSGKAFITYTVLNKNTVMRIGVGNILTSDKHVLALWEEIKEAANDLAA